MSSEIVNYLNDELTTLYLSSTNAKVMKTQRFRLRDNNIPTINKQLRQYKDQAFDSVEQEVYEEIMKETDFDALTNEVNENIKNKKYVDYGHVNLEFKRPNLFIEMIDQEKFDALNASEITPLEFKAHLNSVYSTLRTFEYNVVRYKRDLKRYIENSIPSLCRKFEILSHSNVISYPISRSKRITVGKSLKAFIKSAVEAALSI